MWKLDIEISGYLNFDLTYSNFDYFIEIAIPIKIAMTILK